MQGGHFVADVAAVLGVGALTSVLAQRLKQPTILGYLFAGLVVGPYLPVPVFADPERVESLAEFGVVLVMFAVGLEFQIAKLLRVLPTAGLTGLVQVSFLMLCGFSLGRAFGWDTVASTFLGACLAISSTMVVSKVFTQRPVPRDVRQDVLGVLVIQDVVAIVLIAAMTAVATGGGLGPRELAITVAELAGVLIGMLVGGLLIVPPLMRRIALLESVEIDAVVSLGFCFVMALLAESLGYSVALGAFIAGILVAESGIGEKIEHLTQPVRDMFAAIFFVSIGMTVDPRQAWEHLPTSLLVSGAVVLAQFTSVSLAGLLSGNGLRRSVTAGLSLGQIGEFAFIIAAIGVSADVVPSSLRPVLVTVAVVTAFTTPLALSASDRVVQALDRWMPARVRHLLGLHEEWVERLRQAKDVPRRPARRAAIALTFDVGALLALFAFAVLLVPSAGIWLREELKLEPGQGRAIIGGAALLLAIPLVVGLARNTLALARMAAETVAGPGAAGSRLSGARTIRAMVLLVLSVGIASPAVVTLGALVGTPYALAGFGVLMGGSALYLWRTAGRVEVQYQSAVETIGRALAMPAQAAGHEPPRLSIPTLIPGLDHIETVRLEAHDQAAHKTLAQLNLRVRTGATVLAVHRGGRPTQLPTGDLVLTPGDRLALTGTQTAVALARRLLTLGELDPESEEHAD